MNAPMRLRWTEALAAHFDRKALIVLCLGFASGLPYVLVISLFGAWLKDVGFSKDVIGWLGLAAFAYVLKPVWAPLVNIAPLLFLTRRFGQRRGWLLFSQVGVAGAILGLGFSDPTESLTVTVVWVVFLGFVSATQDIVADAYRIDILEKHLEGPGTANFINGYKVAGRVATIGPLLIVGSFTDVGLGWQIGYLSMAPLTLVGIIATLLAKEPKRPLPTSENPFRAALIDPFMDFTTRRNWAIVLVFIMMFQFGEGLLGIMAYPFYIEMKFDKEDIAAIAGGWGFAVSIAGAFAGGFFVAQFGVLRSLFWMGVSQALANLTFVWLATVGPSLSVLTAAIAVENFTGAMATVAFVSYLSAFCDRAYSAFQFALLTAFAALGRKIFVVGGGELAEAVGWVDYFILTTFAAFPALLILLWLMRRDRHFR